MFAINKEGQVFQVSFNSSGMKKLRKSKVHADRKGWPTESLPVGEEGFADYLICNDSLTTPFGLVKDGVLHAAGYSEREYRALEKA